MLKGKIYLYLIFCVVFMTSCTREYISIFSKDQQYNYDQISMDKIRFIALGNVQRDEFKETYSKHYPEDLDYLSDYSSKFLLENDQNGYFHNLTWDQNSKIKYIDKYEGIQLDSQYLSGLKEKYILIAHGFYIKNRISYHYHYSPYGGGGTSQTEYCVLQANYILLDITSNKVLARFKSTGEGQVYFFTFKAAMDIAMKKNIQHALEFLKTGKQEFFN